MEEKYEVADEESGLTLVYYYDSDYGWSFRASGYPDRETARKAVHLACKYFPKNKPEDEERIRQNQIDLHGVIDEVNRRLFDD